MTIPNLRTIVLKLRNKAARMKQQRFLCPTRPMLVERSVRPSAYLSGYRLVRQSRKARATQILCSVAVVRNGHHLLWHQCISSTSKIHGRLKVVRNGENLAFHEVNMSVENTVVRNSRLSDLQVGYLAGIMDGEGTITFVYHKSKTNVNVIHSPVVFLCAVANSNPLIIESVTSLLRVLGIRHKVFSPKKEWNKKAKKRPYAVHVQGMDSAKAYLSVIGESLSGKKEQATLTLEYLERRKEGQRVKEITERDLQIIATVRGMNRNYGADFTVETKRQPSVTAEEVIVRTP